MYPKKINLIVLITFLFINFSFASVSQAETYDTIFEGFKNTGVNAGYQTKEGGAPKNEFIVAFTRYANGMMTLMGILFMVFMLRAGWLWMSARGNDEQIRKAKNMIINSVIAIGIILFARIIAEFVLYWVGESTTITG